MMSLFLLALIVSSTAVLGQDWVPASNGYVPTYAVVGGTDDGYSGNILYVCKGQIRGGEASGKVARHLGDCHLPYAGEEEEVNSYYVLTNPPWTEFTLDWTSGDFKKGAVPPGAVSFGSGLYVGRYYRKGHYIPGKVDSRNDRFYYPYDGKERSEKKNYQVLVKNRRPIHHYEFYNVEYDLERAVQTLSPDSIIMASQYVANDSPYKTLARFSLDVTETTTKEWSETDTLEMYSKKKITVRAGIPIFYHAAAKWKVTETSTHEYYYGETHTTSVTYTHEVTTLLPAQSVVHAYTTARMANVYVPFTATVKIVFDNGQYYFDNISGDYTDVHQTLFMTFIDDVPLGPLSE